MIGVRGFRQVVLGTIVLLVLSSCGHAAEQAAQSPGRLTPASEGNLIGGPYGRLLAESADLGPATTGQVQVTAALRDTTTTQALMKWAASQGLSVRWQPGQNWAYIDGPPGAFASAFDVDVRNYRSPDGQEFYASRQQAGIPAALRETVSALGRITNYDPRHANRPPIPLDVPSPGLSPTQTINTYNAKPLGTTGKGQTIVVFADYDQDGYSKDTLNAYVKAYPKLGPFKITDINGKPRGTYGIEAEMDLEIVHAIAPDARLVTLDMARIPGKVLAEFLSNAFKTVDEKYPGAIVSLSYGFGCDRFWTETDFLPLKSVLADAVAHGMTIFQSSGDSAGFECASANIKGKKEKWGDPPTDQDIGVDPVAALWQVTDVGGTTLSTDKDGAWLAEETWVEVPVQLGTGGGPSALYDRPPWQSTVSSPVDKTHRLTPDVSADADGNTGMHIIVSDKDGKPFESTGSGTSQAAPMWAGLTALMNEYLISHGGQAIRDINPLLYRAAESGARPAFHDVTVGGNSVYNATVGYDVVTGLGTPDTDALVHDILDIQRGR